MPSEVNTPRASDAVDRLNLRSSSVRGREASSSGAACNYCNCFDAEPAVACLCTCVCFDAQPSTDLIHYTPFAVD